MADAKEKMTALAMAPTSDDTDAWLRRLRADGAERERAVGDLHALLLRAARHELARRRIAPGDFDDLSHQAAGDALVAVLAKLDSFRGASRFTTWAYKFALLEAGVKARRRAWQGREIMLAADDGPPFADPGPSAHDTATTGELLRELRVAIERELTDHQREVFVALALHEVPIDVLAERRGTTRGALDKTLHDARRRLRAALADHDLGAAS